MTQKLVHILPFLDSDEVKDLAIKVINKEVTGVKLVMLYPFLKKDDLEEIVEELIEVNDGKQLTRAIPFVSKQMVNRIYEGIQDGSITGIKENFLYPFLGKTQLKSMYESILKEAMENAVSEVKDELDEAFKVEVEIDDE